MIFKKENTELMEVKIRIKLNENLYVKDPEESKLGQNIVSNSIILINKIGFDKFTIRKLAVSIDSNEPSIYRYFENKQQLLKYLISWYWSWIEYRISMLIQNISDPVEKLRKVINALANSVVYDPIFAHIDETSLAHIVIKNSDINYIAEQVQEGEKDYVFHSYNSLCTKISNIVKEVNPDFPNPKAIAISMIRMTHEQIFFTKYYPKITDIKASDTDLTEIINYVERVIFSTILLSTNKPGKNKGKVEQIKKLKSFINLIHVNLAVLVQPLTSFTLWPEL